MKALSKDATKTKVSDGESFLVIKLVQEMLWYERDSDMGATAYLEKHDGFIRGLGRILELLGLAKLDEQQLIGWRATRRLIRLIADRGARPRKRTKYPASDTDRALLDLLLVAADWDEYSGKYLACKVLEALGLLRANGFDGWELMPELAELFVEASELKSHN